MIEEIIVKQYKTSDGNIWYDYDKACIHQKKLDNTEYEYTNCLFGCKTLEELQTLIEDLSIRYGNKGQISFNVDDTNELTFTVKKEKRS